MSPCSPAGKITQIARGLKSNPDPPRAVRRVCGNKSWAMGQKYRVNIVSNASFMQEVTSKESASTMRAGIRL